MRSGSMRDCKAWNDEGLKLTTSSNDAAKYYDMCLTQYLGWYDDPTMGGLLMTCGLLHQSDPDFFLGQVFNLGMQLLGVAESINSTPSIKQTYEGIKASIDKLKGSLTPRELRHGQATIAWAEGRLTDAAEIYQDILLDHPTDIHALRMVNDTYFYLGRYPEYRDNIARVLPIWEAKRPPLKSYLYGLYSFGLEETSEFDKARFYANKGLEENPYDGFSTHTLAHCYEMKSQTVEGLQMLNNTQANWERSNFLARHNHWHRGLFHVENEEWDLAMDVFDNEILKRAVKGQTMFDLIDCSSLLWRIKMLAPDGSQRITSKHLEETHNLSKSLEINHISLFNDAHQMLSFTALGSNSSGAVSDVSELLETLDNASGEMMCDKSPRHPLLQSIIHFKDERYSEVVQLLNPIRYKLVTLGGSVAQRDVFTLILIISAIKSNSPQDKKLAKALIIELENFKGSTKLCRSLIQMLG